MKLRYSDFAHRLDVDALVSELGIDFIEDDGVEMRAHCPLPYNSHTNGDTTGKFSINREKRVYGCWVCGGGSLLDLAMAMQDLEMEPAIKWAYQFANHEETDDEFFAHLNELLEDPAERQPAIPYFNERVLDRFNDPVVEAMEWDGKTEGWVPFWWKRGFERETLEEFSVRYLAKSRRVVKDELYEGPAIVFPHFWQDRLVGWQQRWLDREEDRPKWVPKYTMTPDFPKNDTLYGYRQAQEHYSDYNMLVVVESVPSALFLWSHGVPTVATFGSNVSEAQMKLLRRFPHVVLAPDNDDAGVKWANALTTYLERFVGVAKLPPLEGAGADIGDMAHQPELLVDYLQMAYESTDTAL